DGDVDEVELFDRTLAAGEVQAIYGVHEEGKCRTCPNGVVGQCKAFDYSSQCNADALDCGPHAILGDTNCDGAYDLCLACPAGTHPVDYDGDGGAELCDCPCGDAVYGQCKGHDYAGQCGKGMDCGPNSILADTNCDGKYDVCLLCPFGTVPADYDGDGCAEV